MGYDITRLLKDNRLSMLPTGEDFCNLVRVILQHK